MAQCPACICECTRRWGAAKWGAGRHRQGLRRLSHDPRNRCRRDARTRPHAPRQPQLHRRRRAADDPRLACGVDRRSPNDQTGQQHAHGPADRGRVARRLGLSGKSQMSGARDTAAVLDSDLAAGALERQLGVTWRTPAGVLGWLATVDHKMVGRRYILTAFVFLLLGGLLALLMRAQLARPENRLVGADLYNQLFTMHGANMMFLFAVPVMEAVAVYIVPLMVGTRNIAFPRLNAPSYWFYLSC